MKFKRHFAVLATALFFVVGLSVGAENRISLQAENDFWFHKDCDYTHATRLAYSRDEWEFAVQQNMYTPNDKKADYPLPDQHPYGGYLAAEGAYTFNHYRRTDRVGLQLGLVGPHTYAEQTQKAVHRMIGDVEPRGWKYQLKDEFIFEVLYLHSNELLIIGKEGGFESVLIGKAGGAAGLAQDYALAGLELRAGYNCKHESDDDIFSVANYKPDRFALYGIAGCDFRAYAYNIFLDGNYHRDSMSVDSRWDVFEGRFGFGYKIFGLDGRALWVYRTKEYETQLKNTQFMSVEFGFSF